MKKIFYITSFLIAMSITVQGQVFKQSFNNGGAIGAYVNLVNPNINQFNAISNYPNFSRSFRDGKLTFKKTGSSSVNIARTTDFSEELKAASISFKIKVEGEQLGKSNIFTHGKFLVGEGFDPVSTAYPDESNVSCSILFNFPNTKEGGQFRGFKIGGKGSLNSVFSDEQTVSIIINIMGKPIQYTSPLGEIVELSNEKYDIWVGNIKVLADETVQNPRVKLKNFKLLIAPQAPNGIELSFDDFVITQLN